MKKNLPLIIDSSLLKQTPKLNTELMKELIKCVRAGIFSLYVPEIIEKEFLTWLHKEIQNAFNTVSKANQSLNKYYEEPSILGLNFDFGVISTQMTHKHMNGILQKATENWYNFKKGTSAIDLPIKEDHGRIVMNSYFNGGKPFSEVKNRNDIPDAFIYCCILDLLKENDKVIFLSQDKKLINLIGSENVECFDSIPALFSNSGYKFDDGLLASMEEDDLILALIRINQEYIYKKSQLAIECTESVLYREEEILGKIIGNDERITTNGDKLSINISGARRINELSALITFKGELEHTVTSLASEVELSLIGEDRFKKLDRSTNESGKVEIEEKFSSLVEGSLSVTFENSHTSSWLIKECPLNIFSDIKEISISVEEISVESIKNSL